jgi:iron-sulfur cluster assembly protein
MCTLDGDRGLTGRFQPFYGAAQRSFGLKNRWPGSVSGAAIINERGGLFMAVTLTEAAARHVAGMLDKRGHGVGLRVGTRKSGCTGYAYDVDYADEVAPADQVFESHGVKVVVDPDSLARIDGMEIDFVRSSLLNQGFEFRNPNVKDTCGCGESFSV